MSVRGLLDADMKTIGRWLAEGWRWWTGELREIVPARLRESSARALPKLRAENGGLVPLPKAGARVAIMVRSADCLVRRIERPALSLRDLRQMVALEADMLLPMPAEAIIVAARTMGAGSAPGKTDVEVVGLPMARAQAIAAAIRSAGVVPVRISMDAPEDAWAPVDFAPAMRESGLLPELRTATPLVWALVGFLICLNIAAVIWRDVAKVEQLEQIVQDQQPAVNVAQTITRRSAQDRTLVIQSTLLRREHDPLRAMELLGNALPENAWLQRYVWDGASVRLVGYRPAKTDIATALRRSGHFSGVRTMADETQASVPAGEPFDISARISRQ